MARSETSSGLRKDSLPVLRTDFNMPEPWPALAGPWTLAVGDEVRLTDEEGTVVLARVVSFFTGQRSGKLYVRAALGAGSEETE